MEFENSRVRIKTQNHEVYEIYKIKIETYFMNDPYTMFYKLMGKTSQTKDEWVKLGHYFYINEDKLFIHLKNIRRLMDNFLASHYISEYDMSIFEQN